jgi:hypothetical protein
MSPVKQVGGQQVEGQTGDMPPNVDRALEDAILDLLAQRAPTATICPSDAARAVGEAGTWRDLMEPARQAAARLVDRGEVEITQGGRVVDLATAKGPIRIRSRRPTS